METGLRHRGRSLLTAVALAVSGFVVGALVVFLTAQVLIFAGVDVMNAPAVQLVISTVMLQGVTFGLLAIGYLKLSGLGLNFLALRRPTLRDAGWTVGGLLVFFVLYGAMNLVISALGVPVAENQVAQIGGQNPDVLLLLVPFSLLLIGPGEELLFRGLIQGTLRRTFRPVSAIVIASAIFAVSHATALSGDGQLTYMAVVFVLALVLGATYEYAENLVIPAVIHGVYNAVLFSALYVRVT
ncbi:MULTISPECIES: CPBP family intramembrane glutamic endopeptidase [Halobacteriales]|uniref:CPBP family intramembrane glutamic endopeptidase n=1 Tax=Halobacteriales TaxID=2235 RepID=UPI0006798D63|nr:MULTISPECIES: type II CAAX endopeptidase family protein [Halobacteria]MDT3436860.1 CPBP family intramembrane metalloprotease [Haloarcula sp. 1CSR25-25]